MSFWNKNVRSLKPEVCPAPTSGLDAAYDAFLYADVCADKNGTPLSGCRQWRA